MVKADTFWVKEKNKVYWKTKTTYEIFTKSLKFLNLKHYFYNEKDFLFYKYICKMYILADIKWNCKNSWFIYEHRRLLKKTSIQKIRIFWFKRFYIL